MRAITAAPSAHSVLYHYIDVRDLAEACRLAAEVPLTGSHALFVGSGETTVSIPLAELYPQLAPAIGDRAARLTGRPRPGFDRTRAAAARLVAAAIVAHARAGHHHTGSG